MFKSLPVFMLSMAFLALSADAKSKKPRKSYNGREEGKLYFQHAWRNIPHSEKIEKGGEDAWHVSEDLIMVADGVGGWADEGVDAGLYSRSLVQHVKEIYETNKNRDLREVLVEAAQKNEETGSSTAVIAKIDPVDRNLLRTTNLGDSAYILYRPDPIEIGKFKRVYKSKQQVYSFNFPYQCGTGSELPYEAHNVKHKIQENDVIMMASDGLFDNMYEADVVECIERGAWRRVGPDGWQGERNAWTGRLTEPDIEEAAECLSRSAEKRGLDEDYYSPFQKQAEEEGHEWQGGKEDDITVIVAQIQTPYIENIIYLDEHGNEIDPPDHEDL